MDEIGWVVILAGIVLGFGFVLGVSSSHGTGHENGYLQGQLDYQKGIIKYELIDGGYKTIILEE